MDVSGEYDGLNKIYPITRRVSVRFVLRFGIGTVWIGSTSIVGSEFCHAISIRIMIIRGVYVC